MITGSISMWYLEVHTFVTKDRSHIKQTESQMTFNSLVVEKNGEGELTVGLQQLVDSQLPGGYVTVAIERSPLQQVAASIDDIAEMLFLCRTQVLFACD